MKSMFRPGQSGMTMVEILLSVGLGGLLVAIAAQMVSNTKSSLNRNRLVADVYEARKAMTLATCFETRKAAEDLGIDCNSKKPQVIKAYDTLKKSVPRLYRNNYGQFEYVSTRLVCSEGNVRFEYALVSENGALRADKALGMKAQWYNLYTGTYVGLQPFLKIPCS